MRVIATGQFSCQLRTVGYTLIAKILLPFWATNFDLHALTPVGNNFYFDRHTPYSLTHE